VSTTTRPRTIARNHTREIAELREQLTGCYVYTLAGQFIAQAVDPTQAWDALKRYSARLVDNGDGTYTIRLHSNHWYTLRAMTPMSDLCAQLADFSQYPPEENGRDGKCFRCGFPVRAHQGLVALGSDQGGTFAAHLHRGCAAEVGAAMRRTCQDCGAGPGQRCSWQCSSNWR
jgi:hypothetical protein